MASSYTDLGIEKMATGENAGTWGTKTNTNLDIIEKAIAGYVEQAVTSGGTTQLTITDGDATESTSVARHAVIKLTGTITGNSIVTVPDSVEKVYIVTNGTSGAYTVQFKTASGTGITFGTSEKTTRLVYSDGTNLVDAGFGGSLDMEGRELVLDADGDTTITADTDDQIDIKIAGADDFTFTANAFNVLTGSHATFADSANAKFGTGNDMLLYHDGSNSYITNSQGALKIATETSGIAVTIGHTTSEVTVADNLTVTGTLTGTLATAAQGSVTSLGTLTTLTVDNIITNGTTIGHTSDTDLLTLTSGVLTVAGEVSATTLDIGGTNISSTAAELNLLDGSAKSTSSITLADSDAIIVIDGTTTKQIPASDLKTYNPGGTSWQAVKTGDYTASAGQGVFVDTTSAAITITLPAGTIGDEVSIIDYAGTFDSNNLTVAANGSEKIHGSTDDLTVATERAGSNRKSCLYISIYRFYSRLAIEG